MAITGQCRHDQPCLTLWLTDLKTGSDIGTRVGLRLGINLQVARHRGSPLKWSLQSLMAEGQLYVAILDIGVIVAIRGSANDTGVPSTLSIARGEASCRCGMTMRSHWRLDFPLVDKRRLLRVRIVDSSA